MGKNAAAKEHLLFIAELSRGLGELQERGTISAEARGRMARWREGAAELEAFLEHGAATSQSGLTDLSDLPRELLDQLSIAQADPLDAQILAVMERCGGRADLDQVLIGLYRQFGVIQKRRFLQNKLWRMVRKGQLGKADSARNTFSISAKKDRSRKARRRK